MKEFKILPIFQSFFVMGDKSLNFYEVRKILQSYKRDDPAGEKGKEMHVQKISIILIISVLYAFSYLSA